MNNTLTKLIAFSIFLCLLLSQAAAVSAAFTTPVRTIAPVKIITNTTTTTTATVKVPTTTTKTYTYDTEGRTTTKTEPPTSSESPEKTTTTTHTVEYNNLGQVDSEVITEHETGTMTDAAAIKTDLARAAGATAALATDVVTSLSHGADGGFIIDLQCPETDTYEVDWPDEPYDFSGGDCESIGNEAAVEEYIQELYDIAKACFDSVGGKIDDMHGERDDIVEYLETVYAYDPNEWLETADPSMMQPAPEIPPMLPMFETCRDSSIDLGGSLEDHDGRAYTHLLESMQEAVNKTCKRAMILNENLVCLCEDVEAYLDGKDWLWPQHKDTLIHIFESYNPNEYYLYNSPNATFNWLLYLNNSWHTYYNPDYISCGQDMSGMTMMAESAMYASRGVEVAMGSSFLGDASADIEVDENGFIFDIEPSKGPLSVGKDEIVVFTPESGRMHLASKGIKDALKDTSTVEFRSASPVSIKVNKTVTLTYFPGDDANIFDGVKATTKLQLKVKQGRLYLGKSKEALKVMPSEAASAAIEGVDGESRDELSVNDQDWDSVKSGASAKYDGFDGESTDESHEGWGDIVSLELVMQGDQPEYLVGMERPVKLLGFIPAHMHSTAHVNAQSGKMASVKDPWWGFIAAK
ncbi:hypothetical protein ACFL3V_06755 [Nanoarchaeota archaeon]